MLLASGDSNGLSTEGIAGCVLLILTEVITLLVWALFIAAFIYTVRSCCKEGNRLSVHLIFCCVIKPPNIYCSVTFELCPERSLLEYNIHILHLLCETASHNFWCLSCKHPWVLAWDSTVNKTKIVKWNPRVNLVRCYTSAEDMTGHVLFILTEIKCVPLTMMHF